MSDMLVNWKALETLKASVSIIELLAAKRYGNDLVTLYILSQAENGLTRSETIEFTGLKWTTQHDVFERLLVHGLVTRTEVIYGRGRPLVVWKIKDELKNGFARLTGRQLFELALNAPVEKKKFARYLITCSGRVKN